MTDRYDVKLCYIHLIWRSIAVTCKYYTAIAVLRWFTCSYPRNVCTIFTEPKARWILYFKGNLIILLIEKKIMILVSRLIRKITLNWVSHFFYVLHPREFPNYVQNYRQCWPDMITARDLDIINCALVKCHRFRKPSLYYILKNILIIQENLKVLQSFVFCLPIQT